MARRIIGLDKLERKLKRLPQVVIIELQEAMAKAAREICDMMEGLVPVDDGDLAASIGWTWGATPDGARPMLKARADNLTLTIYAGSDKAYYARWIEFGVKKDYVAGGMFAGATIKARRSQPFFYVSFRARRKNTKSLIKRAINRAAKKVAAGS